jgi:hypothetical protein
MSSAWRLLLAAVPALLGVLLGVAGGWHGVLLGSLAALVIVLLAGVTANVASRNTASLAGLGAALALATAVRLAGFFAVVACVHGQPIGRPLIASTGILILVCGFVDQSIRQFVGSRPPSRDPGSAVGGRSMADA